MSAKYEMQVFETPEKLSEAACNFLIKLAGESIRARGRFAIALSGGNTPVKLYEMLAEAQVNRQMDWASTYVFWGDERCVPLNDERNNAHAARMALLDKVKIPASNIFPIPVNLPPAEAALSYEKTLKSFFGNDASDFDLNLLGLGDNGHTASLFPGTDVLQEQTRWIKEVYVEEQKMFRVTMTAPFINRARNIAFLVTGNVKAEILKKVIKGPLQPEVYPAQLIKPSNGNLFWFIDRAAAIQLK